MGDLTTFSFCSFTYGPILISISASCLRFSWVWLAYSLLDISECCSLMSRLAKTQRSQPVSPMLQMATMRQSAPQKTMLENYIFRISRMLPMMMGSVPSRSASSVR